MWLAVALSLVTLLLLTLPVEAQWKVYRPGIVELAGSWHYRLGDVALPDEAVVWRGVTLPADVESLPLEASDSSLWLRREVYLGANWQTELAPSGLALLVPSRQHGALEVFAAGQSLGAWSGPPPDIADPPPRLFEIPRSAVSEDGKLVLELRWSWHAEHDRRPPMGPMSEGWRAGDRERLRAQAELLRARQLNADVPLAVLMLLYAAIGLYHLQLFRRDRRCGEYLWFGLTALIVAGNTVLFTHWISGITDQYTILRRLYDVTGNLMVASSMQFLWPFLGQRISGPLRAYQMSFLGLAVLISVMPESLWALRVEAFSKIWSLPFLPLVAQLVVRGAWKGNNEARTVAIGGLTIVLAGTIEMASQLLGYGTMFPLQAIAFTVFALSMAFSLSNRFSRVHGDLDVMRLQLEKMVEDRAGELSSANDRLQSQIAERELAQEAMRMLERAVEQSIDGILVVDLEENILFANRAWAEMHEREDFEVIGRRLELFHSREQMAGQLRPALERVTSEGSWDGQVAHRRKSDVDFPTWMSITLLKDPVGDPVGFVMVARDITQRQRAAAEQQRMEARIQEAEKLRSLADLAGGIAHDYNNLLTGVLGNASLAFNSLEPDSPTAEKLIHIGTAADRAADLTAQLLNYAGAGPSRLRPVDINELISTVAEERRRHASEQVRFDLRIEADLPELVVDEQQLRQAVHGLLDNALESLANRTGVVRIETGCVEVDSEYLSGAYPTEELATADCVFIRVSDSGPGIEHDARGRIFDPFFTTKASGRGLGLATVLSTVRTHSGTIRVESEPGLGATFELLLPRMTQPAAEVDSKAALDLWRGSGKVLVVDDEELMREVSCNILEDRGFEVLTAVDGQHGLELYREHAETIRIVILDRTMPAMSGPQVLEAILELNPEARVLMMSGYVMDSLEKEKAQGIAGFLPKPFRPEELLVEVRRIIEPSSPSTPQLAG
ncbi:MAG: response regulator [Acidobacteriota bacterium]